MQKRTLFLVGLFLLPAVLLARQTNQPTLINRYERGYSLHNLEDNAAYLVDSAGQGGRVAVKICSRERLPIALSIAAADPFLISTILEVDYDFTPERILYLRSEDCLGPDPIVAATEFWAVPNGAALPTSVESIRSNQIQSEAVGTEASSTKGTHNYKAAARELTMKLRARPRAVGVVLGYYYQKPSSAMQRRLHEVRTLLEESGLPQDRYCVRLMRWTGERPVDPPEPEPAYPSLLVIEIMRDSARR